MALITKLLKISINRLVMLQVAIVFVSTQSLSLESTRIQKIHDCFSPTLKYTIYYWFIGSVIVGAQRGGEKFLNPAAAQRAGQLLGINHEDLGKDIFSPPHGTGSRLSSLFASSPIPGAIPESGSISSPSQPRANQGVEALVAFVSGIYEHAFNALVQLINRFVCLSVCVITHTHVHTHRHTQTHL